MSVYCTISFCFCNTLIINEILLEATGVELFRVLITRNLLILGTATTAKKALLPDPLYVYCTKMRFALESDRHHMAGHNIASILRDGSKKHLASCDTVSHHLSISSVHRLAVSTTSGLPRGQSSGTSTNQICGPLRQADPHVHFTRREEPS